MVVYYILGLVRCEWGGEKKIVDVLSSTVSPCRLGTFSSFGLKRLKVFDAAAAAAVCRASEQSQSGLSTCQGEKLIAKQRSYTAYTHHC